MSDLIKDFFNFYSVNALEEKNTFEVVVNKGENKKTMKLKVSKTIIDCYLDNQLVGSFFK